MSQLPHEEVDESPVAVVKPDEEAGEADAPKKKKEKKKKRKKTKKGDIPLPLYFEDPALKDQATLEIQQLEAYHWLMGTGPFEETGKSFSAKITYTGPRRFMSRQLILAKRSIAPNKGNWKTFAGSARLWHGQEFQGNVKDPQFLHDLLTTKGGQKNYSVRFVEDAPLEKKEEKERFLARDKSRLLQGPYRIRKDHIKMGLKPPLNPGEAAQILSELSEEGLSKDAQHITKYLNELITEEARLTKEEKQSEK